MERGPTSWGRWPRHEHASLVRLQDRSTPSSALSPWPVLPFGNGRSYGDVCLNQGGRLALTRGLDRFIAFDPERGELECESGVLLSEIIELVLPYGWFLPVTPGTAFVTVGGAIANDVHGKNHHRAACFSSHVREFTLWRSDGTRLTCSADTNRAWFEATVGGLGLTGLITDAKLRLRRVRGPWFRGDSRRFANLPEFFELSRQSDGDFEYTVAWIDCTAKGRGIGRGVFMRGNHAVGDGAIPAKGALQIPFTPPLSLINGLSLRSFNSLYFHRGSAERKDALWHYRAFLHPLDGIRNWNRIYGPRGFFQYQCVVPRRDALEAVQEMLRLIAQTGVGSFLAVLKNFGDSPAQGILSFARPGTTLALDFPNHGAETLSLLDQLDVITLRAGGAVYPAKDARMSPDSFRRYFPEWERFSAYVDPQFSSSFWRRVTGGAP